MNIFKASYTNVIKLYRSIAPKFKTTNILFNNKKYLNNLITSNLSNDLYKFKFNEYNEYDKNSKSKQNRSFPPEALLVLPFIIYISMKKAQCEIRSIHEKNECIYNLFNAIT